MCHFYVLHLHCKFANIKEQENTRFPALFLYLNERGIVEKNVLLRMMFQKNSVKSTKLWKTRSNLSKFSRQVKKIRS